MAVLLILLVATLAQLGHGSQIEQQKPSEHVIQWLLKVRERLHLETALSVRQQLANTNGRYCFETFGPELCDQPVTFYLWLRKLREKAWEEEIERRTKEKLEQLISKLSGGNPRIRKYLRRILIDNVLPTTTTTTPVVPTTTTTTPRPVLAPKNSHRPRDHKELIKWSQSVFLPPLYHPSSPRHLQVISQTAE